MRKLTVCALCSHLCYTNCWLHSGSGVRQLQKGRVKLGSRRGVRLARKKSGRLHRQLLSTLSLGKPGRLRWKATAGKETQSWEQVWEAWVAVPAEDWDPEMWGGYIYMQVRQGWWWWRVKRNTYPDTKKKTTWPSALWGRERGELCMGLQSEYIIHMEFNTTREKNDFVPWCQVTKIDYFEE